MRAAFDRVLGQSLHLLVPTPEDFVTATDLLRDHASGLRAATRSIAPPPAFRPLID